MQPTYLVQVGRYAKGAYKTKYRFDNLSLAIAYYASINIGLGYKKRIKVKHSGKVLYRSAS